MTNEGTHPDGTGAKAAGGLRIRLFDADRTDRSLTFDEALRTKASARQLLWIDSEGELPEAERRRLVERFEFDEATDRALANPGGRPRVQLHGRHFRLCIAAEPDPDDLDDPNWLDVIAGPNVIVTRHDRPLRVVEATNRRIAEDATIGELDSAEFVASLLDAIVTGYHSAVDGLEDELDAFDARALVRRQAGDLFGGLVAIRRRIGRMRRLLAAHREVFAALAAPDFARGIDSADPEVFLPPTNRFEGVLASLEATRQVLLGSFDILMTRTAQRTNDVMRVLTLATVLALPATITAGFLGMNVIVPVANDDPAAFWLIVGVVLLFEVAVIAIARWRTWI
jgi:magnesium transporter